MTNRTESFEVTPAEAGRRLDVVLAERLPDLSRSAAQHLIDEGRVTVNGQVARPSRKLSSGDHVRAEVPPPAPLSAVPENIPLDIVYQDQDLAVLNKPAGLVVHPSAGHASGTVANALAALFPGAREVGSQERPGIVHRLDKDTSGLMVVALTGPALQSLQREIASHQAGRTYLALATGRVEPAEAVVEAPIGRDQSNRQRMAVFGVAARPAQTSYRVLEYLPGFTLLEVRLHTGRTHQIRVHLAAIGHPVAGDRVYGGATLPQLDRQFLHAFRLSLHSPSTGQLLTFERGLPSDLSHVLQEIRGLEEDR